MMTMDIATVLLLSLEIITAGLRSVFTKASGKCKYTFSRFLVVTLTFFFATFTIFWFALSELQFDFSGPFFFAVGYGILLFVAQFALSEACKRGPSSLSSSFYSSGFIISALFGVFYFNENFNILHLISTFAIVCSFFLMAKREKNKKTSIPWLIFACLGGLGHGTIGCIQKIYSSIYNESSLLSFLFIVFCSGFICSFIAHIIDSIVHKEKIVPKKPEKGKDIILPLIYTALISISLVVVNQLGSYLPSLLPTLFYFSIYNGGLVLIVNIFGIIFFKDKLSITQIIGVLLVIVSIICFAFAK